MPSFTLTQVARAVRSEWLLILLAILSVSLISFAVYSFKKPQREEKAATQIAWEGSILPGTSTKRDVAKNLGSPVSTKAEGGQDSYLYPSTNQSRPNEVLFSNDVAKLIKEQVIGSEKGNLNTFIGQYGQPEAVIYGPHDTFAPGNFWGNRGLLVFANTHDGTIVEIWYFAPQPLSSFLQEYQNFSTEIPQHF